MAGLFGVSLPPRKAAAPKGAESVAGRPLPSVQDTLRRFGNAFTVPGWRESMVAASDEGSSPVQRQTLPALGLDLVRLSTEDDETAVGIESHGTALAADDIVWIYAVDRGLELLIVVHDAAGATITGQVVTPDLSMFDSLEIAVISAAELASLPEVVITRSVRQATNAGRTVWRRIADRLFENTPVRTAIETGLS
ncbi:hypothetical protein [Nocardia salmonicida]|uniref:hypothetical protein n=1 Tax=Nocardia salmonicida TaxID=53431 RepID=UPI0033EC4B09